MDLGGNTGTNEAEVHTAFVLGCTGEVGKELVRALAANANFGHIRALVRKQTDFIEKELSEEHASKVEQRIVDYDNLESTIGDSFAGCDMGFCALGTTKNKAGSADAFVKVDHDYVVNAATLAKQSGCKQFHLVTAQGASKTSWLLYPRTKGLVEEHVGEIGFDRVAFYRPALLLCERPASDSRRLEGWGQNLAKKFDASNRFSVTTASVARAMVRNALRPGDKKIEIISNADIVNLGFNEGLQ